MKIEIGTRVLDNQGHSGIVERIAKSPEVLQKYPNGLYYVSHSVDDYGYKTNTDGWYLPEKLIPLYKCLTAKQDIANVTINRDKPIETDEDINEINICIAKMLDKTKDIADEKVIIISYQLMKEYDEESED